MAIKNIKLLNGDSITANLVSENEYSVELLIPLTTSVSRSPTGDVYLAFSKWLPYTELSEIIVIKKSNIITIAGALKTMEAHYNNVLSELHKVEEDFEENTEGLTLDDSNDNNPEPPTPISNEELVFDNMLATKGFKISGKLKN